MPLTGIYELENRPYCKNCGGRIVVADYGQILPHTCPAAPPKGKPWRIMTDQEKLLRAIELLNDVLDEMYNEPQWDNFESEPE